MNEVRERVEATVAHFARECAPWHGGETVVAAVSGGADSLCLLGALLALRARQPELAPGRVIVAHLDHGLRGAAGAADAVWVAAFAAELHVPCVTGAEDVAALARREHRSLEDAARRARYAFLRRVAAEQNATRICVGHTRDDQTETIVMHWLRGSGLTGLAGMKPLTGDVARPLLAVSRAETTAYCAACGWKPRHDVTNDDPRFLRNRIRHSLLPELERYNPNLRDTLLREAELFREDERYLEEHVATLWATSILSESSDSLRYSMPILRAAPAALSRRLVRCAAERLGAGDGGLGATHVLAIEALLARGRTGASLDLPGRLRVSLEYDTLSFECRRRAGVALSHPQPLEIEASLTVPGSLALPELGWRVTATVEARVPGDGSLPAPAHGTIRDAETGYLLPEAEALLDAGAAGDALLVRTWLPGDRMQPFGMSGQKKLQDVFGDAKMPRALRRRLPLIVGARHLLWVAGLRLDERARITPETRRALRLRLEPLPTSTERNVGPTRESE